MCMALDLNTRALDVRRLAKAHPAFRRAVELGHEPDELLQEIWVGMLVRQQGRSAYDPTRGSFSKWVYIIVRSVISHVIERHTTRGRHEQVGVQGVEEVNDAATWASEHIDGDLGEDERAVLAEALGADVHSEIARFLLTGRSVQDARRAFGPRWHTEVDRLAGRVRERLTESVRLQRGDNDNP